MEWIWVPLTSLPLSAHAMVKQIMEFLYLLRAAPASRLVSVRAATIIIRQFMHNLLEMGMVRDMAEFQGAREDAIVHGTCTARDYLKRVFVAEKRNISVVLNMV